jgi:tRNA A-37 threonylcarbamoyl transferase component Bud32
MYKFQTFTTSYYFPKLRKDKRYMYGLYSAYGGKAAKLYWWLFRNSSVIRRINAVDTGKLTFPYTLIKEVDGGDSLMSFNMGSPGIEQKISILGYNNQTKQPFFAKFAQKPAAMELSKNEIHILNMLNGSGFTPALLDYKITPEFVYLKTEYIKGKRPRSRRLTKEITELSIRLSQFNLRNEIHHTDQNLQLSLSHGDFCPWNFLENNGNIRLIDWETAKERTLGYDLFTYIFQPALLFNEAEPLKHLEIDRHFIDLYFSAFGISDYLPYLKSFATLKVQEEKRKNNSDLWKKYGDLFDVIGNY